MMRLTRTKVELWPAFNLIALALVLMVAAAFTGINIFHFPHYESDEGTYMGSAWAMFEQGKLSYYTYNYDHPPLGWAIIGFWTILVGGFTAFGSAVNAGRTFMWAITVASAVLLYLTVRRATGKMAPGVMAGVLFAVSPLGLDLHRQVWLDNLTTFFLLASLYALLRAGASLTWSIASSLLFGLAFWTKETSFVFLPGMLYLAYALSDRVHRRFSIALWGGVAFTAISAFVLLSLIKDEFLPPGVLWSSDEPHVSLLQTYLWQVGRGTASGDIGTFFSQWSSADPILIIGGLAIACLGILLGRGAPFLRGVSILAVTYMAFLARGGVVLYYYVIPLIGLLALAIGLATARVGNRLSSWRLVRWTFAPAVLACTFLVAQRAFHADTPSFDANQTSAQNDATAWMMTNLPSSSIILMDSYGWVNMRDPQATQGHPFNNAHYYWPGVSDPSVLHGLLNDDWRNVDYLAFSPSLQADIATQDLPLVPQAMDNADQVQTFTSDQWSVTILRVRKLHEMQAADDPMLARSWTSYTQQFIQSGRVVDPATDRTTSEGESYALLRAVYMGDRTTFDQVLGWTNSNLHDGDSSLPAWLWGEQGVIDPNTATDADEQMALALFFAARQWNDPSYQHQAVSMIQAIWDEETTVVGDRRLLVAGNWARGDSNTTNPVLNPSYFAPYAYRIFADVDPRHNWMDLVDSSYNVLSQIHSDPALGGAAGVVPNWVEVDPSSGALARADVMGDQATQFSFDASRMPWQLTLDWLWFKDDRAKQALQAINLPEHELSANGRLAAAYNLDGTPAGDYEATSMYAGTLGGLLFADDKSLVHKTFATKILRAFNDQNGVASWGNPNDYYDQNWGWFATALMDGSMSNLWAGQTSINWDDGLV
jgi:endoglucanase